MPILDKVLKPFALNKKIRNEITYGRGNINDYFPSDFDFSERENILAVRKFTMTSLERLVSLSRAVEYLASNKIDGDIVECGVWRGGSMMLVARKLIQMGDRDRSLYLFDTFDGMSEPGEKDISMDNIKAQALLDQSDKYHGQNVWCYSPLDEVRSNMTKTGYNPDKIFFVKGKVEDTLPHPDVRKIALLRLDTDWYESTLHELETLYDKLVTGGILIIDDYGHWSGSKKAVDEFIKTRSLPIFLNRVDYTGRLAIKI